MKLTLCLDFSLLYGVFLLPCCTQGVKNEAFFVRNRLSGSTNKSVQERWTARSRADCGRGCASLWQCQSFSVGSKHQDCTLYASRLTARDISPVSRPEQEESFFALRPAVCPFEKGYTILPGTGKCVWLTTELANWTQAQSRCEAEGGQLLRLDHLDTWAAVCSYLEVATRDNSSIYIGGFQSGTGNWLWLDGSAMDGNLWHPMQASNDGGEHGLQLWWRDRGNSFLLADNAVCHKTKPSVCDV